MFGKKKATLINCVDDSRVVAHDFRRDLPFESYRPLQYIIPEAFTEENMLSRLQAALGNLSAACDEFNGDCLDSTIIAAAAQASLEVERQHVNHQDTIRRLSARRAEDREGFEKMLSLRREERASLQAEYDRISELMNQSEEV